MIKCDFFVCTRYALVLYATGCNTFVFFNRPYIQLLTIGFFFLLLFLAISCLMQETPDRPTHILHVQQKRVMTPNTAELVVCHF